ELRQVGAPARLVAQLVSGILDLALQLLARGNQRIVLELNLAVELRALKLKFVGGTALLAQLGSARARVGQLLGDRRQAIELDGEPSDLSLDPGAAGRTLAQ